MMLSSSLQVLITNMTLLNFMPNRLKSVPVHPPLRQSSVEVDSELPSLTSQNSTVEYRLPDTSAIKLPRSQCATLRPTATTTVMISTFHGNCDSLHHDDSQSHGHGDSDTTARPHNRPSHPSLWCLRSFSAMVTVTVSLMIAVLSHPQRV